MSTPNEMRAQMEAMVRQAQATISRAVEALDGQRFREDVWERPGGGGGTSRMLENGNVFERAGVNVSAVHGTLPPHALPAAAARVAEPGAELHFFATGLSLVLHPHNPHAPTVHANYRYFQLNDGERPGSWWFGGGADLTPSYLYDQDAIHFHRQLAAACDAFDPDFYPRFKQHCDDYFYLPHRGERRGVGGIFFDNLNDHPIDALFQFVSGCAASFVPSYLPIVQRRKELPYTAEQKHWQGLRRGRYVEFNLLHDRGTTFGLKTGGRVESILMSLPLVARWAYDAQPAPDSAEGQLVAVLRQPRDWLVETHTPALSESYV